MNQFSSQDMILQQNLNMGIFNILKTGNPLIDAILLSIFGTIIANNISKMMGFLTSFSFDGIFYQLMLFYRTIYSFIFKEEKVIRKDVQISAITDEKKSNDLYEAVYWYITSNENIDYLKETPIKFSYDNKNIAQLNEENEVRLNKITSRYKDKKLTYKGNEITYMLGSEIITVYSDEERKKENRSISLSTLIKETETNDILNEFCIECVRKYSNFLKNKSWEPKLYHNKNGSWSHKPMKSKRRIETIILPRDIKKKIMDDLTFFINKKDWFNNIGLPYTRGYLLYGKPGCGKTSLIKGISNYCKRNIHYLILNDIKSDVELYDLLAGIDYANTILVIEDIDCASNITKKREHNKEDIESDSESEDNKDNKKKKNKVKKESGITLSGLLNALDGVNECEGRILIMTTNKPDVLDDALIRPGRIDKKFLFDLCVHEQISDMYEMFFNQKCDINMLNNIEEHKYSPAYIATLFMQYIDEPNEALKNIDSNDNDIDLKPFDLVNVELEKQKEMRKQNNHMNQINFSSAPMIRDNSYPLPSSNMSYSLPPPSHFVSLVKGENEYE